MSSPTGFWTSIGTPASMHWYSTSPCANGGRVTNTASGATAASIRPASSNVSIVGGSAGGV